MIRHTGIVRTKTVRSVLAGFALWAGVTACSAAVGPAPGTRTPWTRDDALVVSPRIPGRPLAIAWEPRAGRKVAVLTRVDPRTLETHGGVRVGGHRALDTAASPDGTRLLVASGRAPVRVFDPRRMTLVRKIALPQGFAVAEVAWVGDRVAIAAMAGRGAITFVRFDPSSGEVLGTRRLEGEAFRFARATDGVVVLAARPGSPAVQRPGPVTVAALHSSGELVSTEVEEVRAGYFHRDPADFGTAARIEPALAVRGSTATIVGVDATIVNVDLTDMTVKVEGRDDSLFAAVGRWFAPVADAKALDATVLRAAWASPGALVVAGYREDAPSGEGSGLEHSKEPAGAVVIDPSDWSSRTIDDDATVATAARGMVLVSQDYVPGRDRGESIGLRAYDPSGELAWHALGGASVWEPVVSGRYAFLTYGWDEVRVYALDLVTGEVLARRPPPLVVLPW